MNLKVFAFAGNNPLTQAGLFLAILIPYGVSLYPQSFLFIYVHVYVSVWVHTTYMHACLYEHILHMCMYVCLYEHLLHICMYVCLYEYILHICMYMCLYEYILHICRCLWKPEGVSSPRAGVTGGYAPGLGAGRPVSALNQGATSLACTLVFFFCRELVQSLLREVLSECVLFGMTQPCQGPRPRTHGKPAKSSP